MLLRRNTSCFSYLLIFIYDLRITYVKLSRNTAKVKLQSVDLPRHAKEQYFISVLLYLHVMVCGWIFTADYQEVDRPRSSSYWEKNWYCWIRTSTYSTHCDVLNKRCCCDYWDDIANVLISVFLTVIQNPFYDILWKYV